MNDVAWLIDYIWNLWDMELEIYGYVFSLRQVFVFGVATDVLIWALCRFFFGE